MVIDIPAAIDTPATIAIIGAGPLGLEAALYARYLGYDARLFDRGEVAAGVGQWSDEKMQAPFGASASKLGLAALHAQDPRWRPPSPLAALTGKQWRDIYLLPLAQSDLLVDALREHCEVASVRQTAAGAAWNAKTAFTDSDESLEEQKTSDEEPPADATLGDDEAIEPNFELQLRSSGGDATEGIVTAHIVVDASGRKAANPWSRGEASSDERVGANAIIGSGIPVSRSDGKLFSDIKRWPIAGAVVTSRAPHYYLLGDAAVPSDQPPVAFVDGLEQIRALFGLIGGRESLNLYATMDRLLP